MSLIADSLKKAVKEKFVPQWDPSQEVNLVGKRDPLKHPGLWSVVRIGLLIVIPTAVLAYLIATGAFNLKKPLFAQKPDLPVSIPPEEAKAPFAKLQAEEAPVLKSEVVIPEVPLVPEKREIVTKKVLPTYPPKKNFVKKLEQTIEKQEKTVVSVPSPVAKPEISVAPKILPKVSKQEALEIVPLVVPAIGPGEEAVVLEKKAMVPEVPPAPEPVEAKVSKPETAVLAKTPSQPVEEEVPSVLQSESSTKPLVDASPALESKAVVPESPPALKPVEEKIPQPEIAKVLETSEKPAEKKVLTIVPQEVPAIGAGEETVVLEKKAVIPEVTPAPKLVKKKILEPEIETKPEVEFKPVGEPILEEIPSFPRSPGISPKATLEMEEKSPGLTIEVQKDKQQVASLPSPVSKPEITRTDPARQENIFQNSDFYFNRAVFFQQAKDWKKALDNYVKAEKQDPNNPDTYNNKGVIFKEMGQYDRAIDEFLRAIFLNPQYAKAYNNIGVVYFMQKNYAEGARNYLKAIDLNPRNLEAFNNLAIIYKKQKDLEKARAVLNRALAMDPDHPGTNYNLAVLYEENKEITPALHYYRRFIELGQISYPALVIQVKSHVETLKPQ